MPTPTFDGDNLLIILPGSAPLMDVRKDLYSEWKLWVLASTNAKFPQAFTTEGGQPTEGIETLGRAYFLRNDLGWRIRPAEEDADVLFDGNLFATDSTLPLFVPTTGAFTVSLRIKFSNLTLVENLATVGEEVVADVGEVSELVARILVQVREQARRKSKWYRSARPDGKLSIVTSQGIRDPDQL